MEDEVTVTSAAASPDKASRGASLELMDDMTEILAERARAGVTALFSSHQLDLVEHICESVAIIHRGRVVAQGAVSDLERGERPRLAVGWPATRTATRPAAWIRRWPRSNR